MKHNVREAPHSSSIQNRPNAGLDLLLFLFLLISFWICWILLRVRTFDNKARSALEQFLRIWEACVN